MGRDCSEMTIAFNCSLLRLAPSLFLKFIMAQVRSSSGGALIALTLEYKRAHIDALEKLLNIQLNFYKEKVVNVKCGKGKLKK